MYPEKSVVDYEKKHGVLVIYRKVRSKGFFIPLSWVRVSKNKKGYFMRGYMIIYESDIFQSETLYRDLWRSKEFRIPLVLKNFKVAQEFASLHGGMVVKICKNIL